MMPSGIPSLSLTQSENLHASLLHQIHIHREQRGSHLMPPGILSLCLGERAVYAKCKGSWLKEYSSQHMTMNACPVDYKLILLVPNAHKKGLLTQKRVCSHIWILYFHGRQKAKRQRPVFPCNPILHSMIRILSNFGIMAVKQESG